MALAFMHNRRPGGAVVVLSGAHLHRYKHIKVVDPTCTEQGYTLRSCKCGDGFKTDYTEALGHTWGEWKSDENGHWHTCLRCGEVETSAHTPGAEATEDTPQTCTVCGYEIAPATGHFHKYEDVVTPPTCTEKGYTTHTCKCGDSYIDSETEPIGHTINFTVHTVPTCQKVGTRYYWCRNNCGYHFYDTIPKTNHIWNGDIRHPICTICGVSGRD